MGPGNGGTVAHGFNAPSGPICTLCPHSVPDDPMIHVLCIVGYGGRSEGDREPLVGCTDGQYINSINSINSINYINYMNRVVSRGTTGVHGSYVAYVSRCPNRVTGCP